MTGSEVGRNLQNISEVEHEVLLVRTQLAHCTRAMLFVSNALELRAHALELSINSPDVVMTIAVMRECARLLSSARGEKVIVPVSKDEAI